MADFSALKAAIQAAIRQNGNNEITGNIMQGILLSMVNTMGDAAINALVDAVAALSARVADGYMYGGIATPTSTPTASSGKVFYVALQAGTYTNYGALVVEQGITILKTDNYQWTKDVVWLIDNEPTAGSDNLVKSGGVVAALDEVNSGLKAIGNGNLPTDIEMAGVASDLQNLRPYYGVTKCWNTNSAFSNIIVGGVKIMVTNDNDVVIGKINKNTKAVTIIKTIPLSEIHSGEVYTIEFDYFVTLSSDETLCVVSGNTYYGDSTTYKGCAVDDGTFANVAFYIIPLIKTTVTIDHYVENCKLGDYKTYPSDISADLSRIYGGKIRFWNTDPVFTNLTAYGVEIRTNGEDAASIYKYNKLNGNSILIDTIPATELANSVICRHLFDNAVVLGENETLAVNGVSMYYGDATRYKGAEGQWGAYSDINIHLYPIILVEDKDLMEQIGEKSNPCAMGVDNFQIMVNYHEYHFTEESNLQLDGETIYADRGVIALPNTYKSFGTPTKLLILCGGTGERIDAATNPVKLNFNGWNHFLSEGYAVMDCNGVAEGYITNVRGGGSKNHFGCKYLLQSYKKAYDYVMQKYNLDTNGCFLAGISMGGLASFMIAQSGMFPIVAQVGFCPCTDIFKQSFLNPWSDQQTMTPIDYGFDARGGRTLKQWFIDNYDNVNGWNSALKNVKGDLSSILQNTDGDTNEDNAYANASKYYPIPLKIIHALDDSIVVYRYSKYLVQMILNQGGTAELRTLASGGHTAGYDTVALNEASLFFKRFK